MRDYTDYTQFTAQLLQELNGIFSNEQLQEITEIIHYYNKYDGKELDEWEDKSKDYEPTKKVANFIAELIDKQARFMFGEFPYITVECEDEIAKEKIEDAIKDINRKNNLAEGFTQAAKDCFIGKRIAIKLNAREGDTRRGVKIMFKNSLEFVFDTLAEGFTQAAKDCFIGKRIAIKLNAREGDTRRGVKIMFKNSLEFVFDTDPEDCREITKLIFYYKSKDAATREEEVWWKQKYELNEQGMCILNEGIYNGLGELIQANYVDYNTQLDFIPGHVILNDALSGDLQGRSDVAKLVDAQLDYNRIDSEDTDALLKGMNQIKYTIDAEPQTIVVDGIERAMPLPLGPGAFWDIQTANTKESGQAQAGTFGTDFSYTQKLNDKLDRNKSTMYELMNIPEIDLKELGGVMTSGKSMKALYWQMILKIKEKFTAWKPNLENMYKNAIKMARIYRLYDIPDVDFDINVELNNPLPEDELEEMQSDLLKVNAQAMSRLQFITKWFECSEDEGREILQQIATEREMLEDSYSAMVEDTEVGGDEDLEDDKEEEEELEEGSEE